jgi:hypothetical protein
MLVFKIEICYKDDICNRLVDFFWPVWRKKNGERRTELREKADWTG